MKRRSTNIEKVATDTYLSLLEANTSQEIVTRIVSGIREALSRHNVSIPVRLSQVAHEFDIEPRPEFADSLEGGELVFRQSLARFIIRLSSQYKRPNRTGQRIWDDEIDLAELEGVGRGRFTYAHEFCHRFFFLRDCDGWTRAIRHVVQSIGHDNWLALRAVRSLEERLCNNIAGEVLVPSEDIVAILGQAQQRENDTMVLNLDQIIRSIQKTFLVSFECATVRVERLIRQGTISVDDRFAAFLIDWTGQKGTVNYNSSGKSREDFRVRCSIIPRVFCGRRVRPLFPGIAVSNLGSSLTQFVSTITTNTSRGVESGKIELPICLQVYTTEREWLSEDARFDARWMTIGQGEGMRNGTRILVWGKLLPA